MDNAKVIEFPKERRMFYDKFEILDVEGRVIGNFTIRLEKGSYPEHRPGCNYCHGHCDTQLVVYYGKEKSNIKISCCGKEKCLKDGIKQAKEIARSHFKC